MRSPRKDPPVDVLDRYLPDTVPSDLFPREVFQKTGTFEKVESLDLGKYTFHRTSRGHSCTREKKLVWKAEGTGPQLNSKGLV